MSFVEFFEFRGHYSVTAGPKCSWLTSAGRSVLSFSDQGCVHVDNSRISATFTAPENVSLFHGILGVNTEIK
ncbi:unnamed protein product [Calypogeia fissa]